MNKFSHEEQSLQFHPHEFTLTMIRDTSLPRRLVLEIGFALDQIKRAWPSFKNDPFGFFVRTSGKALRRTRQILARPHVLAALLSSLALVSSAVLIILAFDGRSSSSVESSDNELSQLVRIDFLGDTNDPRDSGVGAGEQGRVGFERGKGEGSSPEPERSRGGGGGGLHSQSAAQQGRVPVPSEIPAPIPNVPPSFPPTMPVAGIDIDPALWRNLAFASYGDPRSHSTATSNGPGDEGGMGTGRGTGVGEGEKDGFGPGRDGNMGGGPKQQGNRGKGGGAGGNPDDADRVYGMPQVTERARVLSKPEPQYTEEARRNQITGTVVLRVVFSASGEVTNIRAMRLLPDGLTEKAIAAARRIRFLPATKDGHPVSVYMQLEYNFNLY